MKVPLGTIKSWIRRAMFKLKACRSNERYVRPYSLHEDELLAAEYALGVLEGADRATAEQRIRLARRVAEWEQRLAP